MANTIEIPIYLKPTKEEELLPLSEGAPAQQPTQEASRRKVEEESQGNGNAAKALVSHMAGKALSLALGGVGDLTGSYVAQQNLQLAVTEATSLVGAMALGWVGVAIFAVDKAVDTFSYFAGLKRSEAQARFAQKRVFAAEHKA